MKILCKEPIMNRLNNRSNDTMLETALNTAFVWANTELFKDGYERRLWTCPNEPRFVSEEILSVCKMNTQKPSTSESSFSKKISLCEFYIHDLNIDDLGGLVLQENDIALGKTSADIELHLLILSGRSLESEIVRFSQGSHDGWKITAKFLGISSRNEAFPIAILAYRQLDNMNITVDQSVYIAYDMMRTAALKNLNKKLKQVRILDTTATFRQATSRPDSGTTLEVTTKRQILGIHKIQSDLGLRVGFYVSSFANFGGLEQWVLNMTFAMIRIGVNPTIIVVNDTEIQERFPKELSDNLILLKGDLGKIKSIVKDEKLDILILNHTYDSVDMIVDDVKILEVIHNIYFWQQGNRELEILR